MTHTFRGSSSLYSALRTLSFIVLPEGQGIKPTSDQIYSAVQSSLCFNCCSFDLSKCQPWSLSDSIVLWGVYLKENEIF
jgi:hypothetical protein